MRTLLSFQFAKTLRCEAALLWLKRQANARWSSRPRLWIVPLVVLGLLSVATLVVWLAGGKIGRGLPPHRPEAVLWIGLSAAVAVALCAFLALLQRGRLREENERNAQLHEALIGLSKAMMVRQTAPAAMAALTELASRILGMSGAMVMLLDQNKRTLELLSQSGQLPSDLPRLWMLDKLPAASKSLESAQIRFIEDFWRESGPYSVQTAARLGARSAVLIPLHLDAKSLGLLALVDSSPQKFPESRRRLARLLASQAAVILSNSQLYEQMRHAMESRTRLLRQRQAFAAANAAIQPTHTLEDSLKQITRVVPAAMGAELCIIMLTGANGETELAAATPPFDALTGLSGPNPLADEALRSGRPLAVADARHDERVHASWRDVPNVGSILYLPMFRGDRQPLGVLAVARYTTGAFSREQIGLAASFSALAGVVIDNARLLEQTRRDAEAKSLLLRELNHRVKNNLAGIVALLTMNPPQMSEDVRAWLDRATDRIRAMAGAHQLFSGGAARVSLDALVAQTLSSLSVSKPATVKVQTDLDGVNLALTTEQAVGLAMVLHELCYNALVHGLGGGGTLTIRARNANHGKTSEATRQSSSASSIVLEVIDDGGGKPPRATSEIPEGGHGLGLVNGLVRRELRGRFELNTRQAGGTVATVEFPISSDESEQGAK